MYTTKRTYSLVRETVDDFEAEVPAGERSSVVSEALRDWLETRRRQALRRDVIEGCREMADVYQEIEKAYRPLEEEVHRALEAAPEAGLGRPRSSRSGGRVRARR